MSGLDLREAAKLLAYIAGVLMVISSLASIFLIIRMSPFGAIPGFVELFYVASILVIPAAVLGAVVIYGGWRIGRGMSGGKLVIIATLIAYFFQGSFSMSETGGPAVAALAGLASGVIAVSIQGGQQRRPATGNVKKRTIR